MLIAPQNSRLNEDLLLRLSAVRARIAESAAAAGKTSDCITLVAVSKGHGADTIRQVERAGVRHFGESYLQEALPKIAALRGVPITWHFIGRIQTNKTRPIAEQFDWAHGVERLKIAERLAAQRPHYAPPLNVCIQVNIAADPDKAGIGAAESRELLQAARSLSGLRLRGLMCMLPPGSDAERRQHFSALRQLLQNLNEQGAQLDTLSMGMSDDYPQAILEGATMVRIGTAIFGPREAA